MESKAIQELILGPHEFDLVKKLVGDNKSQAIEFNLWHYVAYVKNGNNLIIYQSSNDRGRLLLKGKTLVSYFIGQKTYSFRDLLFVSTLYPMLIPEVYQLGQIVKIDDSLPPAVRRILNAGNGYLLYYHQLEIVYSMLTNCSHEECFLFRRDWNMKKAYTREAASKILINKNISLLDLMLKYTIDDNLFVYQANYHGANLLRQTLDTSLVIEGK